MAGNRYRGNSEHNLDSKGRVALPQRYRDLLGSEFVLCKGFDGRCLYVFSNEVFDELCDKLAETSMLDEAVAEYERQLFMNTFDVKTDAQGRIIIPQKLRDYACLDKECVIGGVKNHVEIWDKELFSQFEERTQNMRVPDELKGIL